MEPKVTIRAKTPIHPPKVPLPPKLEPAPTLPEFRLVSQITPMPSVPSSEDSFLEEELFEVERINRSIPEFLEITPKEQEHKTPEESVMQPVETSQSELNLPEWQPVDEEHPIETIEPPQTTLLSDIPEFEKLNIPSEPTEHQEPTIESPLGQSNEQPLQKLSWRQQRAEKKALRKQEKEEKKHKKIEQKRLLKEQRKTQTNTFEEEPSSFEHPTAESSFETEVKEENEISPIQVNYNNFNGIESIDDTTAEILYKNGYFSIENLREATIEDLVQIPGIKRRLAKQIKKEIDLHKPESDISEFTPTKKKTAKKKEKKISSDSSEWELSPSKERAPSTPEVCSYKGYTLYKREKKVSDGKKTTIHYFSKRKSERGEPTALPDGYRISLNRETGVPYLKKK
jgi:Helix-hairpin-helix domain